MWGPQTIILANVSQNAPIRMDVERILSVTIRTMINFNGDGHGDGMCESSFSRHAFPSDLADLTDLEVDFYSLLLYVLIILIDLSDLLLVKNSHEPQSNLMLCAFIWNCPFIIRVRTDNFPYVSYAAFIGAKAKATSLEMNCLCTCYLFILERK